MSFSSNVSDLATRIATECKNLRILINGNASDLSALNTTAKTNLVAAINELQAGLAAVSAEGAGIDDNVTSTTAVWSSSKVVEQLQAYKDSILGGASAAYDTLVELQAYIEDHEGDLGALLTSIANKVSFSEAQSLTSPQQAQARSNINAAAEDHNHSNATTSTPGFMSGADKTKLDGIAAGANNYTHPTSDGNRHVPATTGGDVNKFLKSGGSAGSNPSWSNVTKADVGLSNVDNTSDANKPVSTAQQTAIDGKLDASHAGSGGTSHATATTSTAGFMSAGDKTKLDGVATGANNYTHPSGDGNLHLPATGTTNNGRALIAGSTAGSATWQALTKAMVGLGNVDNTSDANKPISTATQTALNAKANAADVGDTDTNFVTVFQNGLV